MADTCKKTYPEKRRMVASVARMPAHIHPSLFKVIWDENKGIKYTYKNGMAFIVVDNIAETTIRTLCDMAKTYDSTKSADDQRRRAAERYTEEMDNLGSDDSDPL